MRELEGKYEGTKRVGNWDLGLRFEKRVFGRKEKAGEKKGTENEGKK